MKPVKKVRIGENLIDTKSAVKMHLIKNRTQIRFEFVKDPKYRIYFSHSDEQFYKKMQRPAHQPPIGLSRPVWD